MIYSSDIERKLVEVGYNSLLLDEKNRLIATLGNRYGLAFSQITEDFVLTHHKNLKRELIEEEKLEDIATGFTSSNGHFYSVSTEDQINFLGQKAILDLDPSIDTVKWQQIDAGQWVNHTKEEWLTIFREAFTYKKNCLMQCNILKYEVTTATNEDTVFNVKWINPGLTEPTVPTV